MKEHLTLTNRLRIASVGAIFSLCLALSGCFVQTDNSVNGDKQAFGNPPGGSKSFAAASKIFKQNCMPCHSSNYANWTEEQFCDNGIVVPQQPYNSILYQRLQGSNAGGSVPEDMPQNAVALSAGDLQTVRNWIEGMSEVLPSPTPSPTPSPSSGTLNAAGRTAAALAVISNECSDCHTSAKTASSIAFSGKAVPAFASFTADTDFTGAGLVTAGNAQNSWLIRALKGYGDLNTMPTEGGAIPVAEEAALTAWITNLGNP